MLDLKNEAHLELRAMNTKEVLEKLDCTVKDLAAALGITREAVYQWGQKVPPLRAYQIKELIALRKEAADGLGARASSEPTREAG